MNIRSTLPCAARKLGLLVASGSAILVLAVTVRLLAEPQATTKAPFVSPLPAAGGNKPDEGGKRLREGSRLIDAQGRFDSTGDRWAFYRADSDESFKVLENLALERINKVLEETRASDKPQWIVSGTMTEYAGSNYLLVTKAVIKPVAGESAPSPGASRTSSKGESAP